jgi:D-glycero-D-manno-heptose 1,7-bisphosphate phosphatase
MPISSYTGEPMVPVLYLDIDGTVRWGKDQLGRFVNDRKDVRVFDEVPVLLQGYRKLGWRIVGISNQGGIALGHMDLDTCTRAMMETQRQCKGAFDKLVWCSHHPDALDLEFAVCWCRKPKIGLIVEAALSMARVHDEIYPPHMGLMVGDMESDRVCADNAGLDFMDAAEWRAGAHLREIIDVSDG